MTRFVWLAAGAALSLALIGCSDESSSDADKAAPVKETRGTGQNDTEKAGAGTVDTTDSQPGGPTVPTSAELQAMAPLCGWEESNVGNTLGRTADLYGDNEKHGEAWMDIAKKATGRSLPKLDFVMFLSNKMPILFQGDVIKVALSDKFIQRHGDLKEAELDLWCAAFSNASSDSKDAIRLGAVFAIVAADPLYTNETYSVAAATKYRKRVESVPPSALTQWETVLPKFKNAGVDSVLSIAFVDAFFMDDQFNEEIFKGALSQ